MVRKIDQNSFVCGACGLVYKEEKLAIKCEKWCKKNKSCNLEIAIHAVKKITLN